jgi:hypothetical protein
LNYHAPWWLPGGHAQTIWPALRGRAGHPPWPPYRRERWTTPDEDFVDVDWLDAPATAPLLVLFHGLEGSSNSHYALAWGQWAQARGWGLAVVHFRGCSGEINRAPRAYHSGDFEEIDWMLARMRVRHSGPLYAVGVSLGGNALLRWAQEAGSTAPRVLQALASVSAPVDLAASGRVLGRGLSRQVYTRMFLHTMKPKALQKLAQFPGLFDAKALHAAQDLYDFDNAFTAPLHGFRNTQDYWQRASAKPRLADIRLPSLVVNALNDPFVPASSLPRQSEVGSYVTLWQPGQGGRVGFMAGSLPGHLQTLPQTVGSWLLAQT